MSLLKTARFNRWYVHYLDNSNFLNNLIIISSLTCGLEYVSYLFVLISM